nr:F-box/kelch-repeat protein At3g23880-like [Coffea arabica]
MPVATADLASNSPQELIIPVLSRLPAKSVGKCRCVWKLWRSLLSDPLFIKAHLVSHLHLYFPYTLPLPIYHSKARPFGESIAFEGLNPSSVYLMNPTIRELVKFRHSSLVRDAAETITRYGFGYGSSNDDYKIVTLSYDWRVVETESYPAFVDVLVGGLECGRGLVVFLMFLVRILGFDKKCVLIALDTSCKKFKQLPWPDTDHTSHKCGSELVALGGCLGMVVVQSSHRMDVWMMMEYGVGEFWTKFIVTTPENVYAWGSI